MFTKPHHNSPVHFSRCPIRRLQMEKLTCTRSWPAFRAGNEDICSVLGGYAVLLPGVFDQPFITFLKEWKTMVDAVLLFRLSTQMVELFGLYEDQFLTEATLLVRDRELFAGALFEMIC